jgi:hypothetical protein
VLADIAMVCLLAGCGTGTQPAQTPLGATLGRPAASRSLPAMEPGSSESLGLRRLLYVADQGPGDVAVLLQEDLDQGPVRTIVNGLTGPDGLFVAQNGPLYVVNNTQGSPGASVTVYPPGHSSPSLTYTKGLVYPVDAVLGKDGTLYVADFNNSYPGPVVEYPPGSTTPGRILHPGGSPLGLALDANDNLYVAYGHPSSFGAIKVYAFGSVVGHKLPARIGMPGGITIDGSGNLVVVDQGAAAVEVFRPDSPKPLATFVMSSFPYRLAFDRPKRTLYVSQPYIPSLRAGTSAARPWGIRAHGGPSSPVSEVTVLSYPSGKVLANLTNGISVPLGVATRPR